MVSGLLWGGLLLLTLLAPAVLLLIAFPPYLRYLMRKGRASEDAHKRPPVRVPEPAGPLLFAAAIVGEVVAAVGFHSLIPAAVGLGAGVAFLVGLADDLIVLGGKTKPVLLLVAGLAFVGVVMFDPRLYEPSLTFPFLGDTSRHFIIFTLLAIIGYPVVANAFNMMDAFNGEISWFSFLTSLTLAFGLILQQVYRSGFSSARLAAALPLVAVSGVFVLYNRYPSKTFDGDSGSLMFGAMFAGVAIAGGVEIAAVIAIVPAILNSFYTLSSVRGFVERRRMASRPTYFGDDGLLHASGERSAPNTLIRLILLSGPLSEKDLVWAIVKLTGLACAFSAVISVLTWVF